MWGLAWVINFAQHGHRDGHMGLMALDGKITAANLAAETAKDYRTTFAKVETVNGATHDFGVMAPNEQGEHIFILKNVGDDDLTLELGATSCKCTLGELTNGTLKPGEQTEVKLSWTVKTNKSDFSQNAEIRTNDPFQPGVSLVVVGRVVREVEWDPPSWNFGEVASGESFEVGGKMYSYLETNIKPLDVRFTNKELTDLADFEVVPFVPSEKDGAHLGARQGFYITAKVKGGMRQGAFSVDFQFPFHKVDGDNNPIIEEGEDEPAKLLTRLEVTGRVVGVLSMIVGTKLRSADGSYIYDYGNLDATNKKSLKAPTLLIMRGPERDKTELSIGEITPSEHLKATLGKPTVRKNSVMYPLTLEVIPGKEAVEFLGKGSGDFGSIWIESDNPKVSRMRLAVKFAVTAKPPEK